MLSGAVLNIDRLHALSQIMQVEGDKCIQHGETYQQDDCKKLGMELKRVAVQVYLVFQQRQSDKAREAFASEFEALNTLVALESIAPGSTTATDCPPQWLRPRQQTPRVVFDYLGDGRQPVESLSTGSASCADVRRFYTCPRGGKKQEPGPCTLVTCDCSERATRDALENMAMYESNGC